MRFDVAMRCSANGSLLVLMAGVGGGSRPPSFLLGLTAFQVSLLREEVVKVGREGVPNLLKTGCLHQPMYPPGHLMSKVTETEKKPRSTPPRDPYWYPLGMVLIVALYVPWCNYLQALDGTHPQLYADILQCVAHDSDNILKAAWYTTKYVRLLLSTCCAIRADMRERVIFDEVDQWSVKLHVWDLGGHPDSIQRQAGFHSCRPDGCVTE